MQRTGVRPKVGSPTAVETDVPLGTWTSGQFLFYDGTQVTTSAAPGGGITGPGSTVVGDIVTWNSTTGAVVADSGTTVAAITAAIAAKGDFSGPAGATSGDLVSFGSGTGKLGADSGVVAVDVMQRTGIVPGANETLLWNASTGDNKVKTSGQPYSRQFVSNTGAQTTGNVPTFQTTGSGASPSTLADSGVAMANVVRAGSFLATGVVASVSSLSPPTIDSTTISISTLTATLSALALVGSDSQRVFMSPLPTVAAAATVTTVAYFVYMGVATRTVQINRVEYFTTVAGTSSPFEVGLFSTPLPPNRAAQTLTRITSGVVTPAIGLSRNTTAFAQVIAAGTHVWAGLRAAGGIQPTVFGHTGDLADGLTLSLTTATAFSAATTYAGAVPAASMTAWQAPMLRATVD